MAPITQVCFSGPSKLEGYLGLWGLDKQPSQHSRADGKDLGHPHGNQELHWVGQKLQLSLPCGSTEPPVESGGGGQRECPRSSIQRPSHPAAPGASKRVPAGPQHQALQLRQLK